MFGALCRRFCNLWGGRSEYIDQHELWQSIQLEIESFEQDHAKDVQLMLDQMIQTGLDQPAVSRGDLIKLWLRYRTIFNERAHLNSQIQSQLESVSQDQREVLQVCGDFLVFEIKELLELIQSFLKIYDKIEKNAYLLKHMRPDQSGRYEAQVQQYVQVKALCTHLKHKLKILATQHMMAILKYGLHHDALQVFNIECSASSESFSNLTTHRTSWADLFHLFSLLAQFNRSELKVLIQTHLPACAVMKRPEPLGVCIIPHAMIDWVPQTCSRWYRYLFGQMFFDHFFQSTSNQLKLWVSIQSLLNIEIAAPLSQHLQSCEMSLKALLAEKKRVQRYQNRLWPIWHRKRKRFLSGYAASLIDQENIVFEHCAQAIQHYLKQTDFLNDQSMRTIVGFLRIFELILRGSSQKPQPLWAQNLQRLRVRYDQCLAHHTIGALVCAGGKASELISVLNTHLDADQDSKQRPLQRAIDQVTKALLCPRFECSMHEVELSLKQVIQHLPTQQVRQGVVQHASILLHAKRAFLIKRALLTATGSDAIQLKPLDPGLDLCAQYPVLDVRPYAEQIQLEQANCGIQSSFNFDVWLDYQHHKCVDMAQHLMIGVRLSVQFEFWQRCQSLRPMVASALYASWCQIWGDACGLHLSLGKAEPSLSLIGRWLSVTVESDQWLQTKVKVGQLIMSQGLMHAWDAGIFSIASLCQGQALTAYAHHGLRAILSGDVTIDLSFLTETLTPALILGFEEHACQSVQNMLARVLKQPELLRNDQILRLCQILIEDTVCHHIYVKQMPDAQALIQLCHLNQAAESCLLEGEKLIFGDDYARWFIWFEACEGVAQGYCQDWPLQGQQWVMQVTQCFHRRCAQWVSDRSYSLVERLSQLQQHLFNPLGAAAYATRWQCLIKPWCVVCSYKSYVSTADQHILRGIRTLSMQANPWFNDFSIALIQMQLLAETSIHMMQIHLDWLFKKGLNASLSQVIQALKCFLVSKEIQIIVPEVLIAIKYPLSQQDSPWPIVLAPLADCEALMKVHGRHIDQTHSLFRRYQMYGHQPYARRVKDLNLRTEILSAMLPWMRKDLRERAESLLQMILDWQGACRVKSGGLNIKVQSSPWVSQNRYQKIDGGIDARG